MTTIATSRQQALVSRLMEERDVTGTLYEGWTPNWTRSTILAASAVIIYLETLPKVSDRPAPFVATEENDDECGCA